MKLSDVHHIFFIGIGGIGMSAIARFFLSRGKKVYGYDRTATALTAALEAEGACIVYEDNAKHVVHPIDLVVYTPAVKEGAILTWYQEHGYPRMKRSEVLGWITAEGLNICIAGTHGKTSISSMVAHLLRHSGFGCNAFLGGISANYQTNYWSNDRDVFVVEADEFDRSFLYLRPTIAVVSSTDPDHLDIYGHKESFDAAFGAFVSLIRKNGFLITHVREQRLTAATSAESLLYCGQADDESQVGMVKPVNISLEGRGFRFDVSGSDWTLHDLYMPVDGLHNVENMTAAVAVAKRLGIGEAAIAAAVASYSGVKRRFEYHAGGAPGDQVTYIDDYAHHPTELDALIRSVRYRYPKLPLTLIFQPHLFSRTRDFADAFATTLTQVDELILMPIYPAREKPMPGITSQWLRSLMPEGAQVAIMNHEEVIAYLSRQTKPLIVTAGAGDIDLLIAPIASICIQQNRLAETN